MVSNMAKEIESELSLIKMNISHRTISLDQLYNLLAIATTCIPNEVRAKYLREQRTSTVQADVQIEAQGTTGGLTLQATVRVILKYKGDMVRSSTAVRDKIGNRLQDLAQKYCAEEAFKIIVHSSSK